MLEAAIAVLSIIPSSCPPSPPLDLAAAIETDKRERSVVVELLSEGPDNVPGSQRVAQDAAAINMMCDIAGIEVGGIAHFRMGKRPMASSSSSAPKAPRLLKIIFPGRSHQRDFLAKAREIRKNPTFAKVFIRPSLSAEQRKAEFLLREEKRRRVKNGENVVIFDGKLLPRAEADALRASRRFATGANAVRQGVSYAKAAAAPERMQTN